MADTTAPETTLHARPPLTTTSLDATFSFSSNDLLAEFECALDAETFSGCELPVQQYTGLAIGQHTFQVRAVDLAGNADATPESFTWTIEAMPDTTPPTAPALSATAISPTQVDLAWSASDGTGSGIAGYQIWRDGAHIATAGPEFLGFSDTGATPGANHTYEVVAVDGAGYQQRSNAVVVIPPPG